MNSLGSTGLRGRLVALAFSIVMLPLLLPADARGATVGPPYPDHYVGCATQADQLGGSLPTPFTVGPCPSTESLSSLVTASADAHADAVIGEVAVRAEVSTSLPLRASAQSDAAVVARFSATRGETISGTLTGFTGATQVTCSQCVGGRRSAVLRAAMNVFTVSADGTWKFHDATSCVVSRDGEPLPTEVTVPSCAGAAPLVVPADGSIAVWLGLRAESESVGTLSGTHVASAARARIIEIVTG